MDCEILRKTEKRLEKEAIYELLHYYDKDAKRKLKDMLKKAAGRYVPPEDGIFWDTGLLANGLMELWTCRERVGKMRWVGDIQEGQIQVEQMQEGRIWKEQIQERQIRTGQMQQAAGSEIVKAVKQYFDCWIERGMPVYYMDDALCGVALLRLYEAVSEERYRAGADKLVNYLLALGETEADAIGSIPYRPTQKTGHVYVDGIGMICPFLTMYGVKFGNERAIKLALTQIKNMLEYGMDAKTGLPYHGFRYENKEKYGIIGWGRAVGWLLMGMKGVLYWLREGNVEKDCSGKAISGEGEGKKSIAQEYGAEYRELKKAFFQLLKAVESYQRADGGFSWQLEAMEGPADSSATAMIAQALQFAVADEEEGDIRAGEEGNNKAEEEGSEKNSENWKAMLQSAVEFLYGCEKDGKIYHCLGECMGFSQYPQVYGAYPWSLGTSLEVMKL